MSFNPCKRRKLCNAKNLQYFPLGIFFQTYTGFPATNLKEASANWEYEFQKKKNQSNAVGLLFA